MILEEGGVSADERNSFCYKPRSNSRVASAVIGQVASRLASHRMVSMAERRDRRGALSRVICPGIKD